MLWKGVARTGGDAVAALRQTAGRTADDSGGLTVGKSEGRGDRCGDSSREGGKLVARLLLLLLQALERVKQCLA
jgi:hypothetical protein